MAVPLALGGAGGTAMSKSTQIKYIWISVLITGLFLVWYYKFYKKAKCSLCGDDNIDKKYENRTT